MGFVYRDNLSIQSALSFIAVAFREISSTAAALMNLLLATEYMFKEKSERA